MSHPDFAEENKRLDSILGYLRAYEKVILKQKTAIDASVEYSLAHFNDDNPEQFNELSININRQDFLQQKTQDVAKALLKPYFARVDFTESGVIIPPNLDGDADMRISPDKDGYVSRKIETVINRPPGTNSAPTLKRSAGIKGLQKLYIGKMTLFGKDGASMLIVDWRAPVSTLYYEGRIGEASYDCPDGNVGGEISLKRQYNIEKAILESITDIDITTNDTFLQAALGASRDNRLHDIVTTIQAEQNRIIRAEMFSPLIVQGAAGGGKTTIALHRVAYLLYAYEKSVRPKNIMIIAPSRFFLSYISGVLPELGVENVVQTTFEDFALNVIGRRLRVKPAVQALSGLIEGRGDSGAARAQSIGVDTEADWLVAARVKSSYEFYDVLERYYIWMEKAALPKEPFAIEGYEIISHGGIAKLFLTDYAYLPLSVRLREVKKTLTNTLRKEKKRIVAEIHLDYGMRHQSIVQRYPDSPARRQKIISLLAERDELIERFQKRCKTAIPGYLKKFVIHPAIKYYTGLISNKKLLYHFADGIFTQEECDIVTNHSLSVFNSGYVESEDLAPLMYLRYKAHGLEDELDIKHIVIDEAQDFSVMQFRVLRLILGSGSFSILGDLHQGIYSYKSIKSWDEIMVPPGGGGRGVFVRPRMMTLEQSYRTTVEIMDMANIVIKKLALPNVPLAKPVIRHGDAVQIIQKDSLEDIARAIKAKLREFSAKGYKSVAIICKTGAEAQQFKKLLPPGIHLVTGRENNFEQGIKLFPSYHVKGLEFDAVCVANASNVQYNNELDIKLLYIAMTRALHSLVIYSHGQLTNFLTE